MTEKKSKTEVDTRHNELRKIFIENPNTLGLFDEIKDVVDVYQASLEFGDKFETRGVIILGNSGTGKTDGAKYALIQLGLTA